MSDDHGKTIKVRVSFTDDAGNDEILTSEATSPVEETPSDPLTAGTHGVPQSHDGETVFIFELRFSEEPKSSFSFRTLRDHAFTVTGGEITRAKRLDGPGSIRWTVHVSPDPDADVTIVLPVTADCDAEDRRPLSNRLELTVSGPQSADQNSPATGAPTISGTAQAGQTLTGDTSGIDDEDGLTNVSFSYQWLADDADIQDATASDYEVSDDDVGKAIRVRVSFTDDRDNEEALTSAATGTVSAKPDSQETDTPPSDPSTTVEVTAGDTVAGDIEEASEVDWFKVSLLASETYRIDMRGAWGGEWAEVDGEIVWVSPGTLEDPKLLGVFGEDDALVPGTDRGDSSEGKNSGITSFSPPAEGYYYIAAAAEGAWTATYELKVTIVADE